MRAPTDRVPVQGEGMWYLAEGDSRKAGSSPPGTMAWSEHCETWIGYAKRYPSSASDQDAERVAQRGGFGKGEAEEYLGRPLKTWEPR